MLPNGNLHNFENAPPPDIEGQYGKGWCCKVINEKATQTGIASWLVYAPHAHPAWSYYLIGVIHLREVAGTPPPIMYNSLATHELVIFACKLDKPEIIHGLVNGDDARHDLVLLQPINFAAQFTEISDESACERIKSTVKEICDGALSPDTDFIRDWIYRFGGHMMIA